MVKLKYKYKVISIYKNDRWFTPLFLNFSYNRFKKRIIVSYHRKLKSCYYHKFRFSNFLNRKLPRLVKLVPKFNEKPKIWKRFFRERLMHNSKSFGKKQRIKTRKTSFDPYKMDLSRIPTKYLQYIYFLNNKAYRPIIDQLDFDFVTYKYKSKLKFKSVNTKKKNFSYKEKFYNQMYKYYTNFLELSEKLKNINIIHKNKLFSYLKKYKKKVTNKKFFNLGLPLNLTVKKYDTLSFKLKKKIDFNLLKKKKIKNKKFYDSDYGLKLFMIRKLRLFYGSLPYNQLRKIYKKSLKKNNRGDLGYFIILLESKIDVLLFRSALFSSIFECQRYVREGKIFINRKSIFFPDLFLKNFDFISFEKTLKESLQNQMLINIIKRSIIRFKANHLEVDYKIFKLVFLLESLKLDYSFLDNNLGIIKVLNWKYFRKKKKITKNKSYLLNIKQKYAFPYNKHAVLLKEFFAERMSF